MRIETGSQKIFTLKKALFRLRLVIYKSKIYVHRKNQKTQWGNR